MQALFLKAIGLFREVFRAGLFKSSVYVTVSKVFSSLTNLVFMVYAVNLMTKAENGQFQYYLGFFPVLLALAEFGLPSALVKYLAPVTEKKEAVGSLLVASLVLKFYALLVLLAGGYIACLAFGESAFVVIILIIGSFLFSFGSYFESILVSFRNYYALSIWNPLPNLIRIAVLFGVAQFMPDLGYLEILSIYCLSPGIILGFFFFVGSGENLTWLAEKAKVIQDQKDLAIFNGWSLLASIFAIVSDRMEIFFLKQYHGPEAVAEYATTLQLFSGFVIILSVLNSLVYPKLSRLVGNPEFKPFLIKTVFIGGAMGLALSPGFFLGEFVMDVLFRGNYRNSVPIFHLLYPNFMLQLVFAPLGMALYAMGLPKLLAILALLRLIFGLFFDNALIPDYAAKGAAISLFLGQIVSWLLLTGYFLAMFRSKDDTHENRNPSE
jgi:O-antigen/teichoic acid export membrane protein